MSLDDEENELTRSRSHSPGPTQAAGEDSVDEGVRRQRRNLHSSIAAIGSPIVRTPQQRRGKGTSHLSSTPEIGTRATASNSGLTHANNWASA